MSKKTEILEAAPCLFANKGFKETTMSEVASMIGTAGIVYLLYQREFQSEVLSVLRH